MEIVYLKNCHNLAELKKAYIRALKQHHPDCGGSTEVCQKINAEYDFLAARLPKSETAGDTDERAENSDTAKNAADVEMTDAVRAAVMAVIAYDLDIEIVGEWVWVSGKTYPVRDALKAAGYRWSKGRKKWYFTEAAPTHRHGKGGSFSRLRDRYGSEKIQTESRARLA